MAFDNSNDAGLGDLPGPTGVHRAATIALGGGTPLDHTTQLAVVVEQDHRFDGSIRPTGGVVGDGPFEFILSARPDQYLMMDKLHLEVKFKVIKSNGHNVDPASDIVAPVNFFGLTMWEHVDITLNDQLISSDSSSNAHYKAYIESVLSYDLNQVETTLGNLFANIDDAGKFDSFTVPTANQDESFYANVIYRDQDEYMEVEGGERVLPAAAEEVMKQEVAKAQAHNSGYVERYKKLMLNGGNVEVELITPIMGDFLRSLTYLAPNNKLAIKLFKARDPFMLLSGNTEAGYRIEFVDLKLHYAYLSLYDPSVPSAQRYVVPKTMLKKFPVASGMTIFNFNIHHGGKFPSQIVIGQVTTAASEGRYDKNPFHFRHFDLESVKLLVNGRSVPNEPLLDIDFTKNKYSRLYHHMLEHTGKFRRNHANIITKGRFKNGYTLLPFDLAPDLCHGAHVHESKIGDIEVQMAWRKALPEPITIIVYLNYDQVYLLDANSGVLDIGTV